MSSPSNDQDEPAAKRHKSVIEDLVCPITHELPFDPVTAEDGRVYERSAIEEHFKGKIPGLIRSPITNETMGNRLLPAVQQKNHIQTLIENGLVAGDLADNWSTRAEQKKKMQKLLKKAENGDVLAMEHLAVGYFLPPGFFPQNFEVSHSWCKRAHTAGSVFGTALLGYHIAEGRGTSKCHKEGLFYLAMAAGQGSDFAAFIVGMTLADGLYGLPVNEVEAIKLFQKSLSADCTSKYLRQHAKKKAQQRLSDLMNRSSS